MAHAGFNSSDYRYASGRDSTLGIMDINSMNDLSGSILHIESDLHSTPFVPSNRPRIVDPNGPRPSFPQTPDLPTRPEIDKCFSLDSAKTVTPLPHNDTDTPKALHQPDFLGSDSLQPRNLGDDFQTVIRNPRVSALNRDDLPAQETSPDLPPPPSKAVAFSVAMALTDTADDASVHEVELNESDLKHFDDDFSDIGDFDVPSGDEMMDMFQGQMKEKLPLLDEHQLGELASLTKSNCDSALPPSMQTSTSTAPLSVSWWDQNKRTMDSIFFKDPSFVSERSPERQNDDSLMATPRSSDIFGNMSVNNASMGRLSGPAHTPHKPLAVVSPDKKSGDSQAVQKSESLTNFETFEAEYLAKSDAQKRTLPPTKTSEGTQSAHVTFAPELTHNESRINSKFFAMSDTMASMSMPPEISIATDFNGTFFDKQTEESEIRNGKFSIRDSGVESGQANFSPSKKSLVYQTEDGHWVTDLAFEQPLDDPFGSLVVPDDPSNFGIDSDAFEFKEGGDFMSQEEALAKLDEDQQVFENENVFAEDDAMNTQGASLLEDSDSWILKSHLTLTRPSWIKNGSGEEDEEDSQDYFRISIGQFMQKRTQPLGSLDGDDRWERPTFGRQIKSPPTKPGQALVEVQEEEEGPSGKDEGKRESTKSEESEESVSICDDDTLENKTGDPSIDLSSVVNFITSASADAGPKELAQVIMRMSQKKGKQKQKKAAEKGEKEKVNVRMPSCSSIGRDLSPILSEDASPEEKKPNAMSQKPSRKKTEFISQIPIRVQKNDDASKKEIKSFHVAKSLLGQTGRQRLASTPKREEIAENQTSDVTAAHQEALSLLSRISPSPKDKVNSSDSTLWSGDPSPAGDAQKADSKCDKNIENNCGYFHSKTDSAESFQHNLLPTCKTQKPTLLTDRPLSCTDFAQQYLPKERSHNSWPTALGNVPLGCPSDKTPPLGVQTFSWTTPLMASGMVTSVEAPQQVIMPDVCCVGLSTQCPIPISNPSKHWFQAQLKFVALSIDGQDIDPGVQLPFVLKERLLIGPSSKDEVKVIFAPQTCGVYVAKVHMVVTPMIDQEPAALEYLPKFIVLQGIAEKPLVQINTGSPNSVMEFGSLSWGCQKSLTLKLLNRGRAKIPVRLSLQSNCSSPPFSFERCSFTSGAPSLLSSSSSSSSSMVPTITHITLLPSLNGDDKEIAEIPVYFGAPFHSGGSASLPLQEFFGSIEIQVDSPCAITQLGSIPMQAVAGHVKLHTPCDLEVISLHACIGGCQSHSIPLRNAGNIPMDLTLEVTHWPDLFTVVPQRVTIEPGSEAHVNVKFRPNSGRTRRLESLLLLHLDPDVPGYQLQLEGVVDAPVGPPAAPARPAAMPNILSNKHFLAWGGVDIGKTLLQSVVLKHNEDRDIRISLTIRGATNAFKMHVSEGNEEQVSINREILLKPNEKCEVQVFFRPPEVKGYHGLLVIRPIDSSLKHSITLGGYGGTSQLILEGMRMGSANDNSYWTKVNGLKANMPLTIVATVANTGVRSGYFKAVTFRDLTCKHLIPKTTIRIEPAQMVLQAGFKQELKVTITPSEKEIKQSAREASIVACVALFCGDETSRIKYKQAFGTKGAVENLNLAADNPVHSLDFLSPFLNEDPIATVSDVKSSSRDLDLFYSTMSKITLTLVAQPPPQPVVTKPKTMSRPASVASLATKLKSSLTTTQSSWQPATWEVENEKDNWSAQPDCIVLTAPLEDGGDPEVKKIQLINYSSRDLHFDLSWPGHFILVTPESGVLKARKHTVLNVSAKSNITQFPWKGSLVVLCGGENKTINIRIEGESYSQENTLAEPQTLAASRAVTIPRDPLSTLHNTTEFSQTRDDVSHLEQALVKDRTQIINETQVLSKILDIHPHSLEFAECDSKCQIMRIKIKNLDTVAHNISIVKPKRPYRVRNANFHIMPFHYVRLPVEFNREGFKPGYYQGVLVLRVEGQNEAMQISLTAEI